LVDVIIEFGITSYIEFGYEITIEIASGFEF